MTDTIPDSSELGAHWRVAFEIEMVLDDLSLGFDEPMDEAEQRYCREVANHLRAHTGAVWTAPRNHPKRPGFYVVPEYDIDPINFQYSNQIAGVELLTPPVPASEAETLRRSIIDAIDALSHHYNAERGRMQSRLGWHVNIDPGKNNTDMEPDAYIASIDEISKLCNARRYGQRFTGTQLHAVGPKFLTELDNLFPLEDVNLSNFVNHHAGRSKTYAANFSRSAYLELRHFSVADFFGSQSLSELIGDVAQSFEIRRDQIYDGLASLEQEMRILKDWISEIEGQISFQPMEQKMTSYQTAGLFLNDQQIGYLGNSGTTDVHLFTDADKLDSIGCWDQRQNDIVNSIGILSYEICKARNLGFDFDVSSDFDDALELLRNRISGP